MGTNKYCNNYTYKLLPFNRFRLAYPDLPFEHIVAGGSDRVCRLAARVLYLYLLMVCGQVIESAEWFRAGMFGRYEDEISSLSVLPENNVTISASSCHSLTFMTKQFV